MSYAKISDTYARSLTLCYKDPENVRATHYFFPLEIAQIRKYTILGCHARPLNLVQKEKKTNFHVVEAKSCRGVKVSQVISKNCVSQLLQALDFQDHVTLSLNQTSPINFGSTQLFISMQKDAVNLQLIDLYLFTPFRDLRPL